MSPELEAAIERAKNHVMTPEEVFEQRVSFVWGMGKGDRTKDEIREMLAKSQGRPPLPDGYVLVPRVPTPAMIRAGDQEQCRCAHEEPADNVDAPFIWAAMLDATSKGKTP